jgi:hypothetical protein
MQDGKDRGSVYSILLLGLARLGGLRHRAFGLGDTVDGPLDVGIRQAAQRRQRVREIFAVVRSHAIDIPTTAVPRYR